jgi:phosphomannomutase
MIKENSLMVLKEKKYYQEAFDFADVDSLGEITENDAYMDIHIDEVPLVDVEAVKAAKFKVVVDGEFIGRDHHPKIIRVDGVEVVKLYMNGHFPHNQSL